MTDAVTGSSPVVGSSYSMYFGRRAIARAIPTRFRMPPLSSAGYLSSMLSRSTSASASLTRLFISAPDRWLSFFSPIATFCATVSESNNAANWKT